MSWNRFHRRSEVLRAVVDTLDAQQTDGVVALPWDLPGVAENFTDESDLVGALLLRWHARLTANLERELGAEPADLASAVVAAWRRTCQEHPGIRRTVDDVLEDPATAALENTVRRAQALERARLAAAAGLASVRDPRAAALGRRLELRARGVQDERAELPVPAQRRTPSRSARTEPVAQADVVTTGPDGHTSVDVPATPSAPAPRRPVNESFVRRLKAALSAA